MDGKLPEIPVVKGSCKITSEIEYNYYKYIHVKARDLLPAGTPPLYTVPQGLKDSVVVAIQKRVPSITKEIAQATVDKFCNFTFVSNNFLLTSLLLSAGMALLAEITKKL